MFFEIGVLKIFPMFLGKYLCWSLFSIKLKALRPEILLKDSNTMFFCDYRKMFKNPFFKSMRVTLENQLTLARFNIILKGYWNIFLNQTNQNSSRTALESPKQFLMVGVCYSCFRLVLFRKPQRNHPWRIPAIYSIL